MRNDIKAEKNLLLQGLSSNQQSDNNNPKGNVLLVCLIIGAVLVVITLLVLKFNKPNNQSAALTLGASAAADYNGGNYTSAEKKFTQALGMQQDPSLFAGLITTIAEKGNLSGDETSAFNSAKKYIDQALAKYPNDVNVLLAAGYINETAGKYTEALGYYNKAIAVDGKNPEAWFHKGHVLEFLGQQQSAFQAYDKAYALDPKNPQAVLAKARQSVRKGNVTEAFTYFQQATQQPTIPAQLKSEAFTNMATIEQTKIVSMDKAIGFAKQAVAADPSFAPAAAQYGYLMAINGHTYEGVNALKKAIALNPKISENYYLIGIVVRAGGYDKEAAGYFAYALKRIDNDNTLLTQNDKTGMKARLSYEFAKTLSKLGNQTLALQFVKQAIEENPGIKITARNDVKYKFFEGLAANQEFQSLIKS